MSTYFNIVNLDKKEQASLVICKTQDEVDATIKNWEESSQRKWHREDRDPEFYERQNDGSWTKEAKRFYHSRQKMVMGFIFWAACADQWGHVSHWFGDRVVVVCDSPDQTRIVDFSEADDTYKEVKFYVSYEEWEEAK
jgi:ketopantoate reductase